MNDQQLESVYTTGQKTQPQSFVASSYYWANFYNLSPADSAENSSSKVTIEDPTKP